MTDEPTNWVTVKVPEADRDRAKEYRPDGATFGDCLVAGAERLNEHLDSDTSAYIDDGPDFSATAEITPTLNEEALDDIRAEIESAVGDGAVDEAAIGKAVAKQFDYAMLADQVAERVLREVKG